MARYKPENGKIMDLADADNALKELGLLELELEEIDADMHREVVKIKEKAAQKGDPIRAKIQLISAALMAYMEYNKQDILPKDRKSVDLTFGTLGYRQSTSIGIKKTTLELLKKLNLQRFIRVEETPDKDKMRELEDDALAQVDAVRKVKNEFFAEPNREEIARATRLTA